MTGIKIKKLGGNLYEVTETKASTSEVSVINRVELEKTIQFWQAKRIEIDELITKKKELLSKIKKL